MIRSHIAPSTWTFTERASIPVKSSTNHFSTLGSKRINLRPVWNGQNDVFSDAGDAIQNGAKWRTNGAVVDFSLTWSQLHNLCLPWRRRVKPKGSVKKRQKENWINVRMDDLPPYIWHGIQIWECPNEKLSSNFNCWNSALSFGAEVILKNQCNQQRQELNKNWWMSTATPRGPSR